MDNVIICHFIWKMTSSFAKENVQRSTHYVIEARYVKDAFHKLMSHFTQA